MAVSHILLKHPASQHFKKQLLQQSPTAFRSRSNASKSAWQPSSPKTERKAQRKTMLQNCFYSHSRCRNTFSVNFGPSPGKLHGQCPRLSRALSILWWTSCLRRLDDQTTNPKNTLKAATPRLKRAHFLLAALWVAKDMPIIQNPTVSM